MVRRTTLGAVLLLAVSACGGGGPDSDEPDPTGRSDQPEAAPADVPDPCGLLTDEEAGEVVGTRVTRTRIEGEGITEGTTTCGISAVRGTGADPSLDVTTSETGGASFEVVLTQFTAFPGVEEEELDVPDSDGARLLTEEDDLLDTATAVVVRDGVLYTVLASASGLEDARRAAVSATGLALG